jgi:hypothetical protein
MREQSEIDEAERTAVRRVIAIIERERTAGPTATLLDLYPQLVGVLAHAHREEVQARPAPELPAEPAIAPRAHPAVPREARFAIGDRVRVTCGCAKLGKPCAFEGKLATVDHVFLPPSDPDEMQDYTLRFDDGPEPAPQGSGGSFDEDKLTPESEAPSPAVELVRAMLRPAFAAADAAVAMATELMEQQGAEAAKGLQRGAVFSLVFERLSKLSTAAIAYRAAVDDGAPSRARAALDLELNATGAVLVAVLEAVPE